MPTSPSKIAGSLSAEKLHLAGLAAHKVGRLQDAADLICQAIERRPDWPEALHDLGVVRWALGQPSAALAAFERAIAMRPAFAQAHYNRGTLLDQLGRAEESIAALTRALELRPTYADAQLSLGNTLMRQGRLQAAGACFRRALDLAPALVSAELNLGNVWRQLGDEAAAFAQFERITRTSPNFPEAHNNLGGMLLARSDTEGAIVHFRRAIELRPESPDAYANLGLAYSLQHELVEAEHYLHLALAIDPRHALARLTRATTWLLQGDLARGLVEYEWRWQSPDSGAPRSWVAPAWTGEPLNGRRVLLWAEQGLGDTLQFARYARLLATRRASVVLEVQPELVRLLQVSLPEVDIVGRGDALPAYDVQTPLLSVPRLVRTRLPTIPADVPYLTAEPERVTAWAERLGPRDGRQRIGLVWSGNPSNKNDRGRSLDATLLAPLAEVRGVEWHSLQRDAVSHPPLAMIDRTAALTDFAETAALLMHLDLVLTVDTAVAHLAGALGRPVWILLPYAADWRWLLDRTDSPWYPTARLFRQDRPGDWPGVLRQVIEELGR